MLSNLLAKLSTGSGCRFRQCRMRPRFAIAGRGGQFGPELAHASASRKPPGRDTGCSNPRGETAVGRIPVPIGVVEPPDECGR